MRNPVWPGMFMAGTALVKWCMSESPLLSLEDGVTLAFFTGGSLSASACGSIVSSMVLNDTFCNLAYCRLKCLARHSMVTISVNFLADNSSQVL